MKYIDLLVEDGDFSLDVAGFAAEVGDRQSIGQDIKHRLIESGLPQLLVAQRSPVEQARLISQMTLEVEKDLRLVPGTVRFLPVDSQPGTYYITAVTLEYGDLTIYL